MKAILSPFLSLLLFFQMVLMPLESASAKGLCKGTPANQCTYANDPYLREKKTSCDGQVSQCWDCSLHRCMTTKDDLKDRKDFEACAELEDETAKQNCFNQQATKQTGINFGQNQDEAKGKLGLAGMLSTVYAILLAISMSSVMSSGTCNSKWAYVGSAVVHIAAHFWYKSEAEKEFKKLAEDYKKSTTSQDNNGDGTVDQVNNVDAQKKAFQFLRDEQSLVKKWAGKRKTLYTTLMAGYAIAAGLAIYETFQMALPPNWGVGVACMTQSEEKDAEGNRKENDTQTKKQKLSETQKTQQTKVNDLKKADTSKMTEAQKTEHAKDLKKAEGDLASTTKSLGAVTSIIAGQFIKIGTSPQNIIAAFVSLALAGTLKSAAADEETKAEGNIETIDGVIAKFNEQSAGFCPSRDDITNAQCYCYLEDGQPNKSKRSNSDICKALWASKEKNYNVGAGSYLSDKGPRKGCMTLNKKFDADCKCKKFVDKSTGQNACYKTTLTGINMGLGSSTIAGNVMRDLNSISQGDLATGSFNTARAGNNAIKAQNLAKKMLNAYNNNQKKQGLSIFPTDDKSMFKLIKKIKPNPKMLREAKAIGNLAQDTRPQTGHLAASLKVAQKKAGLTGKLFFKKTAIRRTSKKGNQFKFDFNDTGDNKNGKVTSFSAAKNYNYKENDIVKRDDVSIFKVISNRYLSSGLRRLFDDE